MRAVVAIVTITLGVVAMAYPLYVHAVARDWITVAPTIIESLSARVTSLEEQLSRSSSVSDKAQLKRRLIVLLTSLADQYSYAGQHAEHILSLSRAELIRTELEGLGLQNEVLHQDYFDHAYFLANVGFGAPLRSAYYLRHPEPDYPLALVLFQKAFESSDMELRERAEEQIGNITSPVVVLGIVYYSNETLILALKARNLEEVIVKLTCADSPETFEREWSARFPGADDHRVQAHFYRIGGHSYCKNISARAEGHDGVAYTLSLAGSDQGVWGVREDRQIDQLTKTEVPEITRLSMSREHYMVKENHAMNQGCTLCHIPHAAGE